MLIATAVLAAVIPLEWNPNFRTDVPYEVEICPEKVKVEGVGVGSAWRVIADGKALETEVLKGKAAGTIDLWFKVPKGTKKLECEKVEGGEKETRRAAEPHRGVMEGDSPTFNLFAGALGEKASGWKVPQKVRKETIPGGLKFSAIDSGTPMVTYEVDLGRTADQLPMPVKLELDVKSVSAMTFGSQIVFRQLDANGNRLPEDVSDPRWTTLMRPPQVKSEFREWGTIHPKARKLRLEISMGSRDHKVDEFGMPIKPEAKAGTRPQLEVTRLAMRYAAQLPFPRYDAKTFFGVGVSELAGDCSLKLNARQGFWYETRGQGSWAGCPPVQYRDESEIYFPVGAGTVEAWFKPDWTGAEDRDFYLFEGSSSDIATKPGQVEFHGRHELFWVRYQPQTKRLSFYRKDMKDREFRGEGKAEIAANAWTHVACTFEPGKEAVVYLNGKAALRVSLEGFVAMDLAKNPLPNNADITESFLGCGHHGSRCAARPKRERPNFTGEVDLWRVSSVVRYAGDFTPAKNFKTDADTRALFNFDDDFDGVTGGGLGIIHGTCLSPKGRREMKVEVKKVGGGGESRSTTVQYYPEKIAEENDPEKVLNKLNYPVLPTSEEMQALRKPLRKTFKMANGDKVRFTAGDKAYPDYVEIANRGTSTLLFPLVLNRGDIDARSYGDFAESLGTMGLSDRDKVNKTFNFLLKACDYHISDSAIYAADCNVPGCIMAYALPMINGYCGFECGPLNTMASQLFACSARCPSNMTGGYGHSFQEVFFDGKNHIYDLSAQQFFPSFDNETSVYLEELAAEPGVHWRYDKNASHFMRQSTRYVYMSEPTYGEKVGISLNPGESFRTWFDNAAKANDLFCSVRMDKWYDQKTRNFFNPWGTYEKQTFADAKRIKIRRMERFFPQYGNGFIEFDGVPSAANAAFVDEGASFRYRVKSGYPIVAGEYAATLKSGKLAKNEFSFDGCKSWVEVGEGELTYPVRARRAYWVRVKAAMKDVKRFRACTAIEFNARIFPGRVQPGENEFRFKAESAGEAEVTIAWRENAGKLEIENTVATGTIPGAEKLTTVFDPTKGPLKLKVRGVSTKATAIASEGLIAKLSDGVLTIATNHQPPTTNHQPPTTNHQPPSHIAYVTIRDGEAERGLTVIVAPNSRFVMKPSELLVKKGDKASYEFEPLPAGDYMVLCVDRFASHPKDGILSTSLALTLDAEPRLTKRAAVAANPMINYYKAHYAHPGERANWKWDFPLDAKTFRPFWGVQRYSAKGTLDRLEYSVVTPPDGGAEIAAVLVLPFPDDAFRGELVKVLGGVNSCPERVK